jgi:hypothetical protein
MARRSNHERPAVAMQSDWSVKRSKSATVIILILHRKDAAIVNILTLMVKILSISPSSVRQIFYFILLLIFPLLAWLR